MNYSDMTLLISHDIQGRFELILDYDDFEIYYDNVEHIYFYLECGENDASDCFEVELVASLIYDVNHDLQIPADKAGEILHTLFDCDVCGEHVTDDDIQYLWFKSVEEG